MELKLDYYYCSQHSKLTIAEAAAAATVKERKNSTNATAAKLEFWEM